MNELKQLLKQLRLSGMCEQLEKNIREAQQHQLSYGDFLIMVFQDEVLRRESVQLARRQRIDSQITLLPRCCCLI